MDNRWVPETPHNIHQLERQMTAIMGFIQRRSRSPPSPTDAALAQLVKGCEMAMHSVVLLAAENEQLQTANECQKLKRQLKRRYISKESALSAAEAAQLIIDPQVAEEVEDNGSVEEPQPTQITPVVATLPAITCYICCGFDHFAINCQKC
jgi:hypothetical protein